MIKQGNEEALALMVEKYRYLIAKKIKKFNLTNEFDDCFQEGLMVLYRSAIRFDERYAKSFTRYFERNFENHLISVIRKRSSYGRFLATKSALLADLTVREPAASAYSHEEILAVAGEFSAFEAQVFRMRYLHELSPAETAVSLNCEIKKVYNAMDRIRHKLKMHLDT